MTSGRFIAYRIEHASNGSAYIGITSRSIKQRWSDHKFASKSGSVPLYRAMRKYGVESFSISEIGCAETYDALKALEIKLIASARDQGVKLYNVTNGGDGTQGWVPSNEVKEKIRQKNIEQMSNPERRLALSQAAKKQFSDPKYGEAVSARLRGVPLSSEHKNKLSIAGKGRIVSKETRTKLAEAFKGRPRSAEVVEAMRLAATGRRHTEASKTLMSSKRKGQRLSPERKQAMAEAWERRRARCGGIKGVSPSRNGKWQAHAWICGKSVYLGRFDCQHAAGAAVEQASRRAK